MDPISQGVVGAAFAQTAARRKQLATVAWYGALGGLAPDLDVLFQSPTDPLVFLEYHRQFTHSLVFIPAGAFLVFLVLRAIASRLALLQGLTASPSALILTSPSCLLFCSSLLNGYVFILHRHIGMQCWPCICLKGTCQAIAIKSVVWQHKQGR